MLLLFKKKAVSCEVRFIYKKREYVVYVHISPSNKYYVGITKQKPERRWNNGYGYYRNKHFYNSIKKYGWDNFEHEIIASNLTKEEACQFEITLIEKLNSTDRRYGYNKSKGGEAARGCVRSDETKLKMSIAKTGAANPKSKQVVCDDIVYGSVREFCRKSDLKIARVQAWLGKVNRMPKEWYDKGLRYIDEDMDAYEWCDKNSNVGKSNNISKKSNSSKRVICDGITYSHIKDCADFYNVNHATMGSWLNGTRSMPIEFYNMGLRLEGSEMCDYVVIKKRGKRVICDGIVYDNIKECAHGVGVKYSTLKSWLSANRKEEIPLEYKARGLMFI